MCSVQVNAKAPKALEASWASRRTTGTRLVAFKRSDNFQLVGQSPNIGVVALDEMFAHGASQGVGKP